MRKAFLLNILLAIFFLGNGIYCAAQGTQADKDEYYSFGGHVFSGDFPITLGNAYLFDYDDNLNLLEIATIDTLGYYYFYHLPEGRYIVMAGLSFDDPNYGHFSFTYYPSSPIWEDATIINLTETNWEYDIHLINQDISLLGNGPGLISGNIQITNNKPVAENVDVILFNDKMQSLEHWPTDEFGEFEFDHLPFGDYILYPQIPGFTTIPTYFTISENQNQYSNVQLFIKDGYIASYINEDLVDKSSFKLFPNPSSNLLNIHFNMLDKSQATTQIFDASGRLIFDNNNTSFAKLNNLQINTSQWENGVYILKVSVDGKAAIQHKFVVNH